MVGKKRVFIYILAGLSGEINPVRVKILREKHIMEVFFSITQSEKGIRNVMLDHHQSENSALITLVPSPITCIEQGKNNLASKLRNKDGIWCTHCNKPRHTKETCWKLHGKPSFKKRDYGIS